MFYESVFEVAHLPRVKISSIYSNLSLRIDKYYQWPNLKLYRHFRKFFEIFIAFYFFTQS